MPVDREHSISKSPCSPIRVATAPVNWNNTDLPNFQPVVPFPQLLDEMLAAGYECTEYDGAFGSDVGALMAEADSRSMTYAGAYHWVDFENDAVFGEFLPRVEPRIELLAAIDCRHLIVSDRLREHRVAIAGAVPTDGSASLDSAGFSRIANNLARLHAVCHRHRIQVHYHNHAGTFVETPDEIDQLMGAFQGTGVDLCFDTGHYAFGGGVPETFIKDHLAAIGYIHLKDVDTDVLDEARRQRWSFLESLRHYVFCPLGEGNVDIASVVESFETTPTPIFVIIEQDTCKGDRTANARDNLQALTSFLETSYPDASKEQRR